MASEILILCKFCSFITFHIEYLCSNMALVAVSACSFSLGVQGIWKRALLLLRTEPWNILALIDYTGLNIASKIVSHSWRSLHADQRGLCWQVWKWRLLKSRKSAPVVLKLTLLAKEMQHALGKVLSEWEPGSSAQAVDAQAFTSDGPRRQTRCAALRLSEPGSHCKPCLLARCQQRSQWALIQQSS